MMLALLATAIITLFIYGMGKAISKVIEAYLYGRRGGYRAIYRHRYTYQAYKLGRRAYKKKWVKKSNPLK